MDSPQRVVRFPTLAAQVFALTGLAVAAPLLDVLGDNPTFFVAHDIEGARFVLFGLAVVIVPAGAVLAALGLVRLLARPALSIAAAIVVGGLFALAVVPMIDRKVRFSTAVYLVLLALVALGAGVAYRRLSWPRTFVTYLAPVPVLVLVIFLTVSPAHVLLGSPEDVASAEVGATDTPVVFVVLDELPLGLLLDESGGIDEARFPGFAELARRSTWYPNAATVAPWTHLAVPALLTGTRPDDPVPTATTHPRSLFSLLARSHRLEVNEAFTQLCPPDSCGRARPPRAELAHDTSVVYLHALLPDGLASDWLAPIGERWSGFTDDDADPTPADPADGATFDEFEAGQLFAVVGAQDEQPARFADFVSSITPRGRRPGMWFLHSLLPHLPWQYLPDGRTYNDADLQLAMVGTGDCGCLRGPGEAKWSSDPDLVSTAAQRLALQTVLVDRMISGLLDRLTEQGMLDDTLLVVTADHGLTLEPGRRPRGGGETDTNTVSTLDERVRDEVLPVPLFIKVPGQRSGEVDDRDAQTIDVVPTIVDALDLRLPDAWRFDGRSLLGPNATERPLAFTPDVEAEQTITIRDDIDARRAGAFFRSVLGAGGAEHDLFALGPYGSLLGQRADALVRRSSSGASRLWSPALYDDVDLAGVVPAQLTADVSGLTPDDWVAVAANGTIAGVGPVYEGKEAFQTVAMLDPSLLQDGPNTIDLYRIGADGASLRPLRRVNP